MVVLVDDINGHVVSSNVGYDGYRGRNADGSRILELAGGINLSFATLFMKQVFQLLTYAAGRVKSTGDYNIVRQEDKATVHNVKVILNEECVAKHTLLALLVMDMQFNTTKRLHNDFEPRVHVWREARCVKNTKAWSKIS